MKSRRFMGTPLGPGLHLTTSLYEPCVVHHSKNRGPMAEMGQTRLFDDVDAMSAAPPIAYRMLHRGLRRFGPPTPFRAHRQSV
jgi:hypothetical protein